MVCFSEFIIVSNMMVFCIFLLDFQTLLHEFSIEPRTCQSLSRQVIRSRLNGLRQGRRLSLETLIDRLPLPGRLRDYLAIRDARGSGAESMATSWHGNAFRITGHPWGDPLVNATCPDSKVRGANMGPIWGRQDPGGPHVVPMNRAIWVDSPHWGPVNVELWCFICC